MQVGRSPGAGAVDEIEIHVVRHHQIEMAIAIVVDKRAARAPCLARSRDAGLLGDFGEDAVLVVVEAVLAVVGDVKIFPSVVVVVANANALSPAGRGQAGFGGHVGEGSVMIVAVQMIAGALPGRKPFELRAIHQKDVGPAVVVVVENRDAGSGGFDDVFLGVEPPKMFCAVSPAFSAISVKVAMGAACGRRRFGLLARSGWTRQAARHPQASIRQK